MILRAKYVIQNNRTFIEDGAVVLCGSIIQKVGRYTEIRDLAPTKVIDLGSAVIMPGLINTHIHLELTHHKNLVNHCASFTDWLLQIITKSNSQDNQQINQAISDGIHLTLAGGATTIGNIHSAESGLKKLKYSQIRKVVFLETLGFSPHVFANESTRINKRLESLQNDDLFTIAVTPHAPYSTSTKLYKHCTDIAKLEQLNLSTHIAETREEIEFLKYGTGKFTELLNILDIPLDTWTPPRVTPIKYLKKEGVLDIQPLLAHCNYLTNDDVDILAKSGSSVAFCPRSHKYFHHTNHPIARLISAGVNVSIGTDSLASNHSLSMLDELKFLANNYKELSSETLISLLTINGAKSLKLKGIGKLEKNWQADLIVVGISDDQRPVFEQVCDQNSENLMTIVAGTICYKHKTIKI